MSSTGRTPAERIEAVPISPDKGDGHVVMSLGPRDSQDLSLPELRPGDRLRIGAELQLTADLSPREATAVPDARPVGLPYDFAPAIFVDLLLAADAEARRPEHGRAVRIGRGERLRLEPDLQHGLFVLDERYIVPPAGTPWGGESHINVVVAASHPEARPGQLLLVGERGPGGAVVGDRAQICAIRVGPGREQLPRPDETRSRRTNELPLEGSDRRVLYSLPLERLRRNEQLRVDAAARASAERLGRIAGVRTRVFLADSPEQLEPDSNGFAASVATADGLLSKGNGANCLPSKGRQAFRKLGVLRMLADADRTLHVNFVGVAGDPERASAARGAVDILDGGWLSVIRFDPSRFG